MFESLLENILLFALHFDDAMSFPPPLTSADEKKYLERMRNGDAEAKKILIERNLRLVAHIIKKYYTAATDNEELLSVGTVGLIKGINSFDTEKGVRLATYASRCIENEILMYFRNQKKTALDISFDEPIEQDSEGNPLTFLDIVFQEDTIVEDILLRKNIKLLYKYINELEDRREKAILIMRYGLDGKVPLTQNQIAGIFGISRSYVSRIETKCLKKLRKKFENS